LLVLQGYSRRYGLRRFIVVVTILQTLYDEQKYERECTDHSECADLTHFGVLHLEKVFAYL